jgi:hypothetical protein
MTETALFEADRVEFDVDLEAYDDRGRKRLVSIVRERRFGTRIITIDTGIPEGEVCLSLDQARGLVAILTELTDPQDDIESPSGG